MLKLIKALAWLSTQVGGRRLVFTRAHKVFMERHYLMFPPARVMWANVQLHHILEGAFDEFPHDHGRACAALILSGGYTEMRGDAAVVRRPGDFYTMRDDQFHQLKDVLPETWTLFFVGPVRHKYRIILPSGRVITSRPRPDVGAQHAA